jgi:hypothetical protein
MPPKVEDEKVLEGCGLGCLVGIGGLILLAAGIAGRRLSVGWMAGLQAAYFMAIIALLFRSGRHIAGATSLICAALIFLLLATCGGLLSR